MERRDDIAKAPDELWDPDARRQAFLALSLSERLALIADLAKDQTAVLGRMTIVGR